MKIFSGVVRGRKFRFPDTVKAFLQQERVRVWVHNFPTFFPTPGENKWNWLLRAQSSLVVLSRSVSTLVRHLSDTLRPFLTSFKRINRLLVRGLTVSSNLSNNLIHLSTYWPSVCSRGSQLTETFENNTNINDNNDNEMSDEYMFFGQQFHK